MRWQRAIGTDRDRLDEQGEHVINPWEPGKGLRLVWLWIVWIVGFIILHSSAITSPGSAVGGRVPESVPDVLRLSPRRRLCLSAFPCRARRILVRNPRRLIVSLFSRLTLTPEYCRVNREPVLWRNRTSICLSGTTTTLPPQTGRCAARLPLRTNRTGNWSRNAAYARPSESPAPSPAWTFPAKLL